ncbi:reverse transcriptase domain-containing protein [Tanacetum coccineum]
MGEPTIEEYMTKTRDDYGSSIVRPKFDEKAHFELKGQFLKELRDNTFSGSDNEDVNEHIEKVLEIVDLFHIPDVTLDHIMLQVFPMSLTGAEVISFYNGFDVHTRQILNSKGSIPSMKAADAKKAIQDMADHSRKWDNETSTRTISTDTSDELAVIQAQLNNLGREIKKVNEKVYAVQIGCESCGGPYYTKDCSLKEEGKTLEEAYYTQFRLPFPQGGRYRAAALGFYQRDSGNPSTIKCPKGIAENVLVGIDKFVFPVDFIVLDMHEDMKVLLILGRPLLSTAHAKIDVFKKKITLRIWDDKIMFKNNNPTNSIIRRVYALGLRERMELDLDARLMGEALILNSSLDPD